MRPPTMTTGAVALGLALLCPVPTWAVEGGVDLGSKTSGLGTSNAAQPSPAPSVRVGPNGVIEGARENDTPAKTGLGNAERNEMGGAARGPGTTDEAPPGPGRSGPNH